MASGHSSGGSGGGSEPAKEDGTIKVEHVGLDGSITGQTSGVAPGTKVTVTVTDSEGKSIELEAEVDADGRFTVQVPEGELVDGEISVVAQTTDTKGNDITSEPVTGELDLVPEEGEDGTVVVDQVNADGSISGQTTGVAPGTKVTVTVTDSEGKSIELEAEVDADGRFTVQVPEGELVDGEISVVAQTTDTKGNDITSEPVTGELDLVPEEGE
ncbi:Ig-like domain-containing protein, partial [Alcaligenes faecalis]|uniref:Ig-like domain-containing protein n=1 Tax=Alcaligenes faecalis TaxID=511 RepID=UPI00203CC17F